MGKNNQLGFMALALLAESFIIYASVLVKIAPLEPITLGFYRVFLALPFFYLFARRKVKPFSLPLKDIGLMMFAGVFFAFDLLFFNMSLRHTSVANVNLFASLVCFILVPIGVIFFKEKVRKLFFVGALIAAFGVFVLMMGKGELSVATPYGDFLAFLSVLCYSGFLAVIYTLRRRYGTMEIMFFACVGSSIALFTLSSAIEGFALPQGWHAWGVVALIVFFGQILGQGLFNFILGKLNVQTSSLLLLFSPVIAALMGFFILGEYLGVFEMLGIGIIILGVYVAKKGSL